jgi:hypothetical protein
MSRRALGPRRFTLPLLLLGVGLLVACTRPGPPTVDVEGRIEGHGLLTVAGIVVQAQGQTTVSDGEGRFALAGLTTPYDLVLSQTGATPWLHAYEGLTTAAPLLDPRRRESGAGSAPEAEVNGSIAGGPLPAGRRIVICAEGLDVVAFGCTTVEPGEDAYTIDVRWWRPGPALVRLHALRMVVGVDGAPTAYEGAAAVDVPVADGATSVVPLALGVAPATTLVHIDVRPPSGVPFATGLVLARVSAGAALPLATDLVLTGPITMPVPDLPVGGVTLAAYADAPSGGGFAWAQAAAADLPALELPIAPQPLQPANGATGVTAATTFQAAAVAGTVLTYQWWVSGGPKISLTTTRTEVTMPDLTASGLALPAGAALSWTLYGHGSGAVAGAIGDAFPVAFLLGYVGGLHVDLPPPGVLATGPTRSLTLAP